MRALLRVAFFAAMFLPVAVFAQSVDLSASISDSPDPLTLGTGNITYSASVYNNSSNTANNVTLVLTAPAASTIVSYSANLSGTCGVASQTITCSWGSPVLAFNTRAVTVVVTPTAGGNLVASATASATESDSNSANDTATASTTVNATIDVKVNSISDSPDPITLGTGNVTYTVNLYNESTSKATNLYTTITIPAASTFVSATANNSGTCGAVSGGVFTCSWNGDFNAFNSRAVTVVVTPTAGGTATLSATVGADQGDPDTSDNTLTQSTTVNATIDLKVSSISDSPDPITLGTGNITYTVNLYNESTSKATNLYTTVTIPAASTFVSATANNSGTCGTESGGVFTCNWSGDFNAFNSRAVTVVITPTAGGLATLSATVGADQGDPDSTDNIGTQSTTVNDTIDVKVSSISDSPDPITLGTGNVTYTVNLYNESTSKATNLSVAITIPAASTYVSATANLGGTCGAVVAGSFTCNWSGDFNAFNSRAVTVVVTPTAGGTATLSATVAADQGDPDPSDNTLTQSTTVNATIDLKVSSISDSPDPITLGTGNITYTVNLYNESTSKATNAYVTITIPSASTFVSASANNSGTCGLVLLGVFTCSWSGDFNAFNSRAVTVVVMPTAGGTATLSATVGADQGDPDSSDNTLTQSTTVNATIDLKVSSISDSPDPITLGTGNVTYTVNLYNESTSKATNPFVTITIPAASTFVSASANNSGTCGLVLLGVFTCSWSGDFNAFNSRAVTVVVTPTAGGTATLSATVGADQGDPDTSDNTLTQSTTVNATIDLKVSSISDSPDPITLGTGNITYTVNLYNESTSKATNAFVTIAIPAASTFVSASANNSGTCGSVSGGTFTCNWSGNFDAFNSRAVTVVVTPTAGGTATLSATVGADQGDPDTSDNTLTQSTTVNASIDIQLTMSDSPDPRVIGAGNVTYTVNLYNASTSKATNPVVAFTLPATGTFVSATANSGGACSAPSGGAFTCTWAGDYNAFNGRQLIVVVTPTSVGQISATASVSADQPDPVPGNNSATNTTNINPSAPPTIGSFAPGSGPIGTTVTITGSNFYSTSLVKFNGVSASFVVVSNTQITATVPSTTTGTINITNASGNTSSALSFTVTPAPDLTITKSASAATVATSSTFDYTLNVSNSGAGAANDVTVVDTLPVDVTLNSIIASGWSCSGTTTITCTAGALGAGNSMPAITINVTAPATGTTVSNTATVSTSTPESSTANNSGTVSVGVTGCPGTPPITAPATVCANTTGHTASIPAVPGATYLWTATNGAITAGATSNVITFDANTATPITLNVTVNVTSCPAASNSFTVNVSTPSATITPSGPTTFCSGGSVTLTANNGSAYSWSSGETTQSIVVTNSGAYSVTVTNAAGCATTSAATNVTVNATPTATITPSGPTNFCSGGAVTLNAPGGMTSYLWSNGATTSSITATSSGNYTVTVTNASGCGATSAPVTVTVDPTPAATITASGPTTFCSGGSVTLSAPAGMTSYLWSNGATTSSIAVTSSGTFSVQVTNGSCSATSAPTTVTVNPAPIATITASGPTNFCSGGSVQLSAPGGMNGYVWSTGETTPSIVVTSSGNYFVTVTDGSGCSATSAPTSVSVTATPVATITPSGPTTFCAGGSVTLTAGGTGSYFWSNGATTPSIVVTNSGSFTVQVTNGTCSSTSSPVNVVVNPTPVVSITGPAAMCSGSAPVTLDAGPGFAQYAWSNGATTPQIIVSPTNTTTYTVTVTDGAGCSATDSHVVTVTTTPTATITAPSNLCEGAVAQNASVAAQPGATYAWSITNGTITSATNTNAITFDVAGSGPVMLNVTVANGSCITPGTKSIAVSAYPSVTISGPTAVCPHTPFTLSVPAGFASYLWSNGATGPSISASQTEASKTWSVTVTNAGGCATTVSQVVSLSAQPVGTITAPASAAHNATGLVASVPAQAGASYDWSIVNGTITSGQGTRSITFTTGASSSSAVVGVYVTLASCTVHDTHSIALSSQPNCPFLPGPQLTAPAANAVVTAPVTFTWTAVNGATGYRLFIDANGSGAQLLATTTNTTSATATVPAGAVIAWVEASFDGCPSTRSANVAFNVRTASDGCGDRVAATPLAPANRATLSSSNVDFHWSVANGAIGYRLWTSLNDAAPVVLGTTADSAFHATLAPGRVTWFIEALYEGCASTESARSTFTIPAAPECGTQVPQLVSPASGTSLQTANVTFQWSAVSGALGYEVWLSLDNGSPALLGTTQQTSFAAVAPAGKLEWFVRVLVDRCPARDSAHARFTVDLPVACDTNERPLAIAPVDHATTTSPASFSWTATVGATRYDLFIIRGDAAPQLVSTTTTPQAQNVTLTNGNVRWFVRAHFANGCPALDSTERALNIVSLPPACSPLARPVIGMPGQISSGVPFLIQWTPLPGATSYELQLAPNAAFTGAESIGKGTSTQHLTTRTNDSLAPVALFARVRATDNRCDAAIHSDWSLPVALFVLPAQSEEATLPLTSPSSVTFPIVLGPELAGQTFTATPKQPWLSVAPAQGTVPQGGTSLTVTANTAGLPVGTNLGAVTITLTTPSAGGVTTSGTTAFTPGFSLSLVTPVTPTPKTTPPPDALIIPAVAHASGINSQFQSDIRVSNTSPRLINYQVTFTPSGDAGISEGKQTTFSIEAGQTIALDDVLRSWFGTGSVSTTGTLEIRPLTESTQSAGAILGELSKLVTFASSRTFNVTPHGTFGQYIPAVPFANFAGQSRALSLQQIAQSSRYRTNLGIVEGSGEPASLLVKVFGDGGAKLTEFPLSLNGGQHLQLNSFLTQHGISSLSDGRVEVAVTSSTGKVTAYASVLDNETSDPLLVTPVTLTEAGATKWVMPGVADIDTGGANWQTDMRVFNAGTEDVTATLTFHSQNGGEAKTANVTIPAGQVKQFDRALASLFSIANDGGAVHITTPNASRLIATARTYNQTSGGTYGQFISAVTRDEAAGNESRPLQLLQVEESTRFRTNVGLAEVTGNPVTLEISVVPPDSKFTAVTELTLGANEFRQLNSLLRSVGLDDTYNARVTVRAIGGDGRVAAYASVIDLVTNDPTYVPAQ